MPNFYPGQTDYLDQLNRLALAGDITAGVAQANADAAATALDRTAVHNDKLAADADAGATATDRNQTGLDRTATGNAVTAATQQVTLAQGQVTLATAQVALATTQAGLATTNGQAQVTLAAAQVTLATAQTALAAAQAAAALANANNASSSNTSAQTALAGTTNAATQAANARDQAIAAWGASMAPAETLPAISKSIHFGAIVKAIIYDTGKDTDGGAWRKRCTDKSWYNEALGGTTWLNQAANELAARGDNLLAYPEEIDNAAWFKAGLTITPNTTLARDGTTTADTAVVTTTSHSVRETATVIPGGLYAFSFDAQRGTMTEMKYSVYNVTGTADIVAPTSYYAQTNAAGLSRITVLFTAPAGCTSVYVYQLRDSGVIGTAILASAKLNQVGALSSTYSGSPESVTNGTNLTTATGWTGSNAGISAVNGALRLTAVGSGLSPVADGIPFTTIAGHVYSASITLVAKSFGSNTTLRIGSSFGGTDLLNTNLATTPGANQFFFTATSATTYVRVTGTTLFSAGDTIDFNNISIKEVTVLATPYVPYSALVGSYYQNTTDGKYYALGATYGTQVEVFRGNVREMPEQVLWIAEAARVIGYDATQPGCPMWMVFVATTGSGLFHQSRPVTSLAAFNGIVYIGLNDGVNAACGVIAMRFLQDNFLRYSTSSATVGATDGGLFQTTISSRNTSVTGIGGAGTPNIVNNFINDIAVTVLDGAPVDPASGMKVPTVAVGTAGGVSVILDSGVVVNDTSATGMAAPIVVFLDGKRLARAWSTDGHRPFGVLKAGIPTASSSLLTDYDTYFTSAAGGAAPLNPFQNAGGTHSIAKDAYGVPLGLVRSKVNFADRTKTMFAAITNAYNTGWQVGDIRGAYLADSVVETITASGELVTNGTNPTVTTGWQATQSSTIAAVSSVFQVTATGSIPIVSYPITTVVGKSYQVSALLTANPTSRGVYLNARRTAGGTGLVAGVLLSLGASGILNFIAQDTTTYISVEGVSTFVNGETYSFNLVSTKLADPDRSVKNNGLVVNGTLTKAAVATGASLVAYSGFSAANYLRQPYNAGHDYGTGEWDIGAWLIAPTTLPVSSFPVIGSETIPNGSFDTDLSGWTISGNGTLSNPTGHLRVDTAAPFTAEPGAVNSTAVVAGKTYIVTFNLIGANNTGAITLGGVRVQIPGPSANSGSKSIIIKATGTTGLSFMTNTSSSGYYIEVDSVSVKEVGTSICISREAASGPNIKLGIDSTGLLVASAYDGTTTRTVTSPSAVNTGTAMIGSATYRTDGSLALVVNGTEVARTNGTPLLTMNNANAVLTVGNSYALDAPFPGSLALLTASATAPIADQVAFIYRTELPLFQAGAKCVLPGASPAITALTYDDTSNVVQATQADYRSAWVDLLCVETAPSAVGTVTSISANQGSHIIGGSTGAKYVQPALLLRDELRRRNEQAAKAANKVPRPFAFVGDGTTSAYVLPLGLVPQFVYKQGLYMTGNGVDYNTSFDGFRWTVTFLTVPLVNYNITIMGAYQ